MYHGSEKSLNFNIQMLSFIPAMGHEKAKIEIQMNALPNFRYKFGFFVYLFLYIVLNIKKFNILLTSFEIPTSKNVITSDVTER